MTAPCIFLRAGTAMPAQARISAHDHLPVAAVCLSLIVIWMAALVAQPPGSADAKGQPLWAADASDCFRRENYRPVVALAPGLVFGPLGPWPPLLVVYSLH